MTTVDRARCYRDLHAADANANGVLSPSEYHAFVRASAGGRLDVDADGRPFDEFSRLPPAFADLYDLFACGSAAAGCPGATGFDVGGVAAALAADSGGGGLPPAGEGEEVRRETRLYQLCRRVEGAVDGLGTPTPTGGPTAEELHFYLLNAQTPAPKLFSSAATLPPAAPRGTSPPPTAPPAQEPAPKVFWSY